MSGHNILADLPVQVTADRFYTELLTCYILLATRAEVLNLCKCKQILTEQHFVRWSRVSESFQTGAGHSGRRMRVDKHLRGELRRHMPLRMQSM